MNKELTIVIPASGMGRRMKSYGPKCLIDIGGETLIQRQIKILTKEYPYAKFVLVVGFEAEKIYKHIPANVQVTENHNYIQTNVTESLRLGLEACDINAPIMIVYGDLVFNKETFSNLDFKSSFVIVDNNSQMKADEVGVNVDIEAHQVLRFSYGLPNKWAQIAYLKDRELELFKIFCSNNNHRKYYGFEIMNLVLDAGGLIKAITPKNMRITDIDTSKDIETTGWINK